MISTRQFSDLILSVRTTAVEVGNWEPFLDQLSRLTNSTAAFVILRRPDLRMNKLVAIGGIQSASERATLFPQSQKLYTECYGSRDPYDVALVRSRLNGVIPGERLIPRQLLQQSDMYHALLAPHGLEHMCVAPLTRSHNTRYQLAIWRSSSPGPFSSEDCDWLELLIPHVETAISVQRRLGLNGKHLAYSEAMLHGLEQPMFLLDYRLRVVHYNRAAERLLQHGEMVRLRAQTLEMRNASCQREFRDLTTRILAGTQPETAYSGSVVPLRCSDPHHCDLLTLLRPIYWF